MKFIRNIIDGFEPLFDKKTGKLKFFYPVFEAASTFMFMPRTRPTVGPLIRDGINVKRFMTFVIIAVLPALLFAIYSQGLRVLSLVIVSYAVGGMAEALFSLVRKEDINEGFLVTAMLYPLLLPITTPLWVAAIGIIFGVVVGKEIFGGTGYNIFNPALTGRAFVFLAWPIHLSPSGWVNPKLADGSLIKYLHGGNVDGITSATPLSIFSVEKSAAAVFEKFSISDMFLGNVGGSIGEVSSLLLIIGGLFLIVTKVANFRMPLAMLGSIAILSLVLSRVLPELFAPVSISLFSGGAMFGAFFMTTDPVSAPNLNVGKWIYGGIIGTMVVLIRGLTPLPEGVMFSILFGNICAPLIDEMVLKNRVKKERLYAKG